MGNGLLQRISQGQAIYLVHGSQTVGKTWSLAQQNNSSRLQSALQQHDFVIQYKKGSNMPVDYLSRLPGMKEAIASISAFDPFQTDFYELQMQDEILQGIQTFRNTNQWPEQGRLGPVK